jgi:hypothetical protein
MAGSFVQGNTSFVGSVGAISLTCTLTGVTAGDLIVFAWGCVAGPTPTITDNQGNTWTGPQGHNGHFYNSTIGYFSALEYCIAKSSGTLTVTIVFSSSATYIRMMLHEYSGYGTADAVLSGGGYQYGTGITNPSTSLTTTAPNDLVFAWAVDNNGITSFTSPLATRLTNNVEATGDNAGATNSAGSQTIACTTGGQGGTIIADSFYSITSGKYVQSTNYSSGSTTVTSHALAFASNVTAGDLIVVALGWGFTGTANYGPPTITDSQGNTYTKVPAGGTNMYQASTNLPGYAMGVYYATAGSTGVCTITVTPPVSTNYFRMAIHEYSGYGGLDTWGTADVPATPSIALTSTGQNDLFFGWMVANNGAGQFNTPSGIATREIPGTMLTSDNAGYPSVAGSVTVSGTSNGGGCATIAAAFTFGSTTTTVAQAANVVVAGQPPISTELEGGPVNVPVAARSLGWALTLPAQPNVGVSAYNPTVFTSEVGAPGVAAVFVTGWVASVTTGVDAHAAAALASATVAGFQQTASIHNAGIANVPVAAYNPTVSTGIDATPHPGVAAVAVAVYQPTVLAQTVDIPVPSVVVEAAFQPSTISVGVVAQVAGVGVAALSLGSSFTPAVANVTVGALQPAGSGSAVVAASVSSVAVVAYPASVGEVSFVLAGTAAVTVSATISQLVVGVTAGTAVSVTAQSPVAGVAVFPQRGNVAVAGWRAYIPVSVPSVVTVRADTSLVVSVRTSTQPLVEADAGTELRNDVGTGTSVMVDADAGTETLVTVGAGTEAEN